MTAKPPNLSPNKALIFRATHRDNISWILDHGLHCQNSGNSDPDFVPIGNSEIIENRADKNVPAGPMGTLGDYIPFYFTPYSPMLLNLLTGHGPVTQRRKNELIFLVSSIAHLSSRGIAFCFADRNAALNTADFSDDIADLNEMIPWQNLRNRDFKKDPEDPEKFEKYMCEALVHQYVPIDGLLGVAVYDEQTVSRVKACERGRYPDLRIEARPGWYF